MSWLDFANHFLSNQRLHVWSWINRTSFLGTVCFFVGILALSVLGLFLFCFCLVWGEQATDAPDFGWQSKGEDHFRLWFPFFFSFTWWQFCIVQILSGPKDLSAYFFCFLSILDWEFPFFFCFLSIFDWEFFSFCFDICQGVGLASGSGIKGMSHIISMTHMQQWWLGNSMQNLSCMHPCGHSSIKFLWSCDTRAHDSFPLFKSTQCFQNMFFYQFMHSSESILGVRENFYSIHPSGAYTFLF